MIGINLTDKCYTSRKQFFDLTIKLNPKALYQAFWYPHLLPRGGGGGGGVDRTPVISKTVTSMNVKFCRILETPLKISGMLKLFT